MWRCVTCQNGISSLEMPLTYLNDFIRMSLSNLWFLNLIAIGFFFFFFVKFGRNLFVVVVFFPFWLSRLLLFCVLLSRFSLF